MGGMGKETHVEMSLFFGNEGFLVGHFGAYWVIANFKRKKCAKRKKNLLCFFCRRRFRWHFCLFGRYGHLCFFRDTPANYGYNGRKYCDE